jgi:hypothetical protein
MIHHFLYVILVVFLISLTSLFITDARISPGQLNIIYYCPLKCQGKIAAITTIITEFGA